MPSKRSETVRLRFRAFKGTPTGRPLVVVDLGYSARRSSGGVTPTGRGTATNHRFGVAVIAGKQALADRPASGLLALPSWRSASRSGNLIVV
jgi:hypothetical protein